jgi:hypothetical protein
VPANEIVDRQALRGIYRPVGDPEAADLMRTDYAFDRCCQMQ